MTKYRKIRLARGEIRVPGGFFFKNENIDVKILS